MSLDELFERFLKERTYLKNVTPKTIRFHRQGWNAFCRFIKLNKAEDLSKAALTDFVIAVRSTPIKAISINTYIRSINAFLVWLFDNEYIKEQLKIKQLNTEAELIKTLTMDQLRSLINFKPQRPYESRIHTLILVIIDTGMRIEEALSLKMEDVDLDSLSLKIMGKGRKQRIVPISLELRKVLIRYFNKQLPARQPAHFLFCTRQGNKLLYDNVRRDYEKLCSKVGIERLGAFHRLRHTFATNYVRNGGNVLYLSKILGHTTLQMTKRYVTVDIEALQEAHLKTSLISKLR